VTTIGPSPLPTSGKPSPATPPSPEVTQDLAWRYGRDLLRLHMVDPEKLHALWEVTDETLARVRGRDGRLAIRLVRLDGGERPVSLHEGVFAVQNWYWDVAARARYRAELGWQSREGFQVWLASNEVETPSLEPNVTAEVVFRSRKGRPSAVPRDPNAFVTEDEEPSARPRDAASAAGTRRRETARELARGDVRAWSRTAIPPKPPSTSEGRSGS
jgi:hypothetical protein